MRLTYKYRLYPNNEQERRLQSTLNTCRLLYNSALEEQGEAYRLQKASLSYNHQQNKLPAFRRGVEHYRQRQITNDLGVYQLQSFILE